MFQLRIIVCSVMPLFIFADSRGYFLNNDVILTEFENDNLTKIETVPIQLRNPYVYNDDTIEPKKGVHIVINPVIHNNAHGHGGGSGDRVPETTTQAPTTTTSAPTTTHPPHVILLADSISVVLRKMKYLKDSLVERTGDILRGLIRFVICSFLPICGLFSILGDEADEGSLSTPDGIARGIDFVQRMIEEYHSARISAS